MKISSKINGRAPKFQENQRDSKLLQEDEKSCPMMPKNTLQAMDPQEKLHGWKRENLKLYAT